ncbi:hypothetical protein GZ78_09315 [Endozoicomonas numazuensis]|uniref:DNA phosphorothioation-dependent restriction protein DptG n=1 Tax=Endozoicomonas numazuensis TaxID=1137799 RepID=A0A081NHB9_9GAMM|nr:hypothetical protein GZ78_09315 [Endozoicomonas numazuensis]
MENVAEKNDLNNYLPIRGKNNTINYGTVAGKVLGLLLGKELNTSKYSPEEFKNACLNELSELQVENDILEHIEKMYFRNNALTKVSPEFLLLGQEEKEAPASKYLSQIFRSFLKTDDQPSELDCKANFIEAIFIKMLQKYLLDPNEKKSAKSRQEQPYLPYMADNFSKDIRFLSGKTEYLLTHFEEFLELYNFLYCSQLALNIRSWTSGEPRSQKMYFILDTEKASQERSHIKSDGFYPMHRSMATVFPILSLLDTINKQAPDECVAPLWQYGDALVSEDYDSEELATQISQYAETFALNRKIKLRTGEYSSTPIDQLRLLVRYALDQFERSRYTEKKSRHEVRDAYLKQFDEHIAKHFVQNRGSAGRVLVLNQDYLLLLTNLTIGANGQLRFQELLKEFQARGVYFDKQSEQALIAFYERVGNVDRMSDSGDAVYVRSTI